MQNKSNESGRTMLEMLGVLAIMGVIMYGAIAGIGFGVETYKINATYNMLEDLSQGIVDLYSWSPDYSGLNIPVLCQNDVVECVSTQDQIQTQWSGTNIAIGTTNDGHFLIEHNGLSPLACARLRDMTYSQMKVDETTEGNFAGTNCQGNPPTLLFISR